LSPPPLTPPPRRRGAVDGSQEEGPSITNPRPFRGGVRGGVNQKLSYPISVVTVFISSTPNPSSQEEGSHERTPPPRRRGLKAKNEIFLDFGGFNISNG